MEVKISSRSVPPIFTDRQYEVLALVLQGHNHRQIATMLGLAELTIRTHMVDIWDQLCDPRNKSYSLGLLNSLQTGHSNIGGIMAFRRVKIGQRFEYQGQLYEKVDRARDQQGAYNAVALDGQRSLFFGHIQIEVNTHE